MGIIREDFSKSWLAIELSHLHHKQAPVVAHQILLNLQFDK